MKALIGLLCLLVALPMYCQTSAGEVKATSLAERYWLMKSSSQTYEDYKVIKEWTLDKEWKIVQDSLRQERSHLKETREEARRLEAELKIVRATLAEREESIAPTEYAAANINFFGVDFNKGLFIGLAMTVIGGLIFIIAMLVGRLRLMQSEVKEKSGVANDMALALEQFKRSALEKQIKLSRELQTERNRLQELQNG